MVIIDVLMMVVTIMMDIHNSCIAKLESSMDGCKKEEAQLEATEGFIYLSLDEN